MRDNSYDQVTKLIFHHEDFVLIGVMAYRDVKY